MKRFYLSLLVLILISCADNSEKDYRVKNIEINLKKESLIDYKTMANMVEKVSFIPLKHITEESLIGYIDKIVVTDAHIAIMDESNKILNLYDWEGNFVRRIGKIGQGPGEYVGLGDFQIYNDTVFMFDAPRNKMLAYTIDGEFVAQRDLPFQVDIFSILDNNLWLWGVSSYNEKKYKDAQIISTDKDFDFIKEYVGYNKNVDHNVKLSYYFVHSSNKVIYHQGLENEVYIFQQDGTLSECLYFDFGEYNIKKEYIRDVNKLWESNDSYCYLATTPILTDSYIVGTLNIDGELHSFIYNSITEETVFNSLALYHPAVLNLPIYINNNTIFSYFNSEIFPDFQHITSLDDLTKKAIADGEYVLVKYHLY